MAKRKIKKLLKGLGMGAALLGAGRALMNRRDKANQMKEFLATEGGDISDLNIVDEFGVKPRMTPRNMKVNPAMFLRGVGMDPVFGDLPAGAKKGGRIMKTKKGGKAVRGFAKKKKQANKMRKK
jgi:hypothetical protein